MSLGISKIVAITAVSVLLIIMFFKPEIALPLTIGYAFGIVAGIGFFTSYMEAKE